MNSQMLMQTSQLFVGLLTLGILGLIVDRIFRAMLAQEHAPLHASRIELI